mgnify:CR=1 FL=1
MCYFGSKGEFPAVVVGFVSPIAVFAAVAAVEAEVEVVADADVDADAAVSSAELVSEAQRPHRTFAGCSTAYRSAA